MIKETLSRVMFLPGNQSESGHGKSTRKNKVPKITVFALSALGLLTGYQTLAMSLVETAEVKLWQNGANHSLHCKVQTSHLIQLSSLSRAKLNWVLPAGSRVEQGQLIARQDGYFLEREIEQLEIDLASASAEFAYADKEFRRLDALEKQLVSPSTLNELQRRLELARLSKAGLANQLKEANYRYRQLEHFAPQNGQLLALQAQPGQYLNVGDNITRLQPAANKELVCELPLSRFRENQSLEQVAFSLSPGHELTLLRTSDSVDSTSQTLTLYLKGEDEIQEHLLPGERLQVNVSYRHADLSLLPLDALELTREGTFAWYLEPNNKVKKTPVKVVASQKDYFVVKSVLQNGDRVVTLGKQGLAEAQQVQVNTNGSRESE
ncbi:efflux RND transporter periplasmic adaptor subunit [Thalassomonas viridans]|uniref:Efflux RND transporter periplasmic adaptor subunit n=1 Tax=Thalassomonas viridans TaxID=137584 RepID=A0AAE9ZAA2_9GAMM|nr:efflux RND transporter periplasmic adaptor subunit [Thalassomonas viridans]WDE07877.1 efflux RND transporter periplasmic adaptor subunit [Thalassomonas viridans]